ncbi:MAG: tetratricopeptide repeat protein [Gammaproteobacteria bacterium]|nr:tetratricopeptide repeat protein [Gammaproteobacteria bacterium]NIR97312.1 tetratricopeptide repeat protein [Gammaproteobacteria bacterium]NIT63355.1 tetratricopeptide repeat protein [Gammaproteobacteria bacterium]NIV20282.1 tetratricopeptide repeat protein [Gammaproteobacteria bacterium]NIX10699.1 tetratricopeptide repeat protein [Gammaproteobacteria bacterium]
MPLLLAGVVAGAYHAAPENSFHLDDATNITDHPPVQMRELTPANLLRAGREAHLPRRPLPSVTFAWDWWRGGGSPEPFQWTNLAIHALAAIALFGFLDLVLRRVCAVPAAIAAAAAFCAAGLWAAHPIQVQAVTYIVQRMTSMAALLALLSVLCFLMGRLAEGRVRQVSWFALCGLSMAGAVMSKENAWITPMLLWLSELTLVRRRRPPVEHRADWWLILTPAALGGLLLIDLAAGISPLADWLLGGYATRDFTLGERLLTQPRVILFHFSQILWPWPDRFSIEHDLTVSTGLLQPPSTAAGLLLVAAWCGAGAVLWLKGRNPALAFFWLWPPLALVIESSVIPLEMIFEHRMYFPSMGLAGMAAVGLATVMRRGRRARVAACLGAGTAVALLAVATAERVQVWRTPLRLLQDTLSHAPFSPRVWNNLGKQWMDAGRAEAAVDAFNRALRHDFDYVPALKNRATYRLQSGRPEAALADLDRAVELRPRYAPAYLERGNVHARLGEPRAAVADYSRAIELQPRSALAFNNRGLAYMRLQRYADALSDFDRALEAGGATGRLYGNRGTAYLLLGQPQRAVRDLGRAVALDPSDAAAWYNRGRALEALGRPGPARRSFAQACRRGLRRACGSSGRRHSKP